jgi:hypothetical protein
LFLKKQSLAVAPFWSLAKDKKCGWGVVLANFRALACGMAPVTANANMFGALAYAVMVAPDAGAAGGVAPLVVTVRSWKSPFAKSPTT